MDNDHTDYCRRSNNSRNFEDCGMQENLDPQVVLQNQEERGFDEILIDAVKSYPHLYDTSCKDYRDAIKKENSWVEIAGVLNATPQICSTRWTRLRESYSKEKKKKNTENKSGSGAAQRRGFVHFEAMRFIDKFVKTRSSVSNVKMTQPFSSTHQQSESRNQAISKWVQQQGDFTSEIHSSSSQQDIINVSKSTNRPTPCTTPEVMNFEEASSSSSFSTDFTVNEFENRSASTSNESSYQSPLASPTIHETPNTFKKPPSYTKGRFNPYITIKKDFKKKEAENDEFEASFINFNKVVTAHLVNKKKPEQTCNDHDHSFGNLIVTELNRMKEDEKINKKREILKILWQNSSPKKD
ncbi:transcription factor Adf-1 [Neodiprion lecontei]|uniref:Transcription factor Adf-1 n=1 Tax=Neodiprion lecontei TaxID=441921 RepID=A0ABM3FZX5_NEOLC|nr:transcription factor Adf-1 [Neodiprion lecontei]XP_046593571.1 transcription factor Adf-1 [Neodiprion lecontei]